MDLFKSVLSENDHHQQQQPESNQPLVDDPTPSSLWSFGDLIKTLTTKSESVIGSYRRDFVEFGSELKKETSVIRLAASRAVNDLPDSLDIGASVAQQSLESVGQAIDDLGATVWKSTAKIISHGKQSLLSSSSTSSNSSVLSAKPYSRFDTQLLAIQSDKGTYVREPEDLLDFENWVLEFKFDEKGSEIVELVNENKAVKDIYDAVVPVEVDVESFWKRYYYKVHKLEQAEEARVKLMSRAISGDEEEDLSWDLDEEGDEIIDNSKEKEAEKVSLEKAESREVSSKDSDISVISTQPSLPEVEDLGWDQMEEDIRSNEEKFDRRRRVNVAEEEEEEDEDLNWDIEDESDDDVSVVKK